MDPEPIITADGSHTLYSPEAGQHYHSTFGAIAESRHIFIDAGFRHLLQRRSVSPSDAVIPVEVLEIGFGTGLNALLCCLEAEKTGTATRYTTLEPFPLTEAFAATLNYPEILNHPEGKEIFGRIHSCPWDVMNVISPRFTIKKCSSGIDGWDPDHHRYDLVFFDAFSPDVCPDLWNVNVFSRLAGILSEGGILVTYSVKGSIVRALRDAGFDTEKLPGPVGKRHILRAIRRNITG